MTTLQNPAPPSAPTEPLVQNTPLNRVLITALRVGIAFLWIENTGWKRPPDFSSLRFYVEAGVEDPVFGPYSYVLQHVVLPHFTFFAWGTLLVEVTIGVFLLVGLATRLFAVIGLAQVVAITLSALNAPNEWEWSYYLMMVAHVALFVTAAGRYYGLDGLLRPRWSASDTKLAKVLVKAS